MRRLAALPVLASLALASPARADHAGPPALTVSGAAGQQALALRVTEDGVLARVCAAAPCEPEGGAKLSLPAEARPRWRSAKIRAATRAGRPAVAIVEIPGEAEGSAWAMIVAPPLKGKGGDPVVLWSGSTGSPRGEAGEERSAAVIEEAAPEGTRVLVGERRADVTICGRPALVGAREVSADLTLARASGVMSLPAAERAAAPQIKAVRIPGAPPRSEVRALRATAASSAVDRKLAAITDGDPSTAWSENKLGDGRGEFVSMSAPDEVAITAIDLILRPAADVPDGAAPKKIFLATTDKLFAVTIPEDASQKPPGTHYAVSLPAPVRTSCLAVVLDESYAPAGKAKARVSIAEVEARTAFDGATPESLAGALAGGGARAKEAAALLARAGEAGTRAVIAAYDKLDDAGRRLAAGVVDAAACKDQVPFFAARFAAATAIDPRRAQAAPMEQDPDLIHARDRLRRCGRGAAEALAKLVAEAAPRTKVAAAEELAALAPDAAVPAVLAAIDHADDAVRRDLRAALARAAKSHRALPALGEELQKAKGGALSEKAGIDLLRAAGPALGKVEGAGDALAALASRDPSLRARYLLQIPAAELARAGDRAAEGYVREALRHDQDPHVRARAAEAAAGVPALAADLLAAIGDADPRVREAAIGAFAQGSAEPPAGLGAALGKRLAADDWTFVRSGAARAIGALPAGAAADAALAAALSDRSPEVRRRAVDGLAAHRAAAHVEAVRARQDDADEDLEVRARAVLALGALCDARSAGTWTDLARRARMPLDDRDRRLGGAAVAALGDLHPPDLAARLAPVLDKDAPVPLREMAKAALAGKGICGK